MSYPWKPKWYSWSNEESFIGKLNYSLNAMDQLIWWWVVWKIINWLYECWTNEEKIGILRKEIDLINQMEYSNKHYTVLIGILNTNCQILEKTIWYNGSDTKKELIRNHQWPFISKRKKKKKKRNKENEKKSYNDYVVMINQILDTKYSEFTSVWFNKKRVNRRYYSTIFQKLSIFDDLKRNWFETIRDIPNYDIIKIKWVNWERLVLNLTDKKILYFKQHKEYDSYLDNLR